MKKILTLMRCDLTNALRDSMVLYVLVAPLLLAGVLRLFLPSMEGAAVTVAVQTYAAPAHAAQFIETLEDFGRVEIYRTEEEVRRRVRATDDVGGFVRSRGGDEPEWRILLEGNEPAASEALMRAIYEAAMSEAPAARYTITEESTRSPIREYANVALVMLAMLIGGLVVAFTMIDEKEQDVTRAYSVSPLTPTLYFAARGLLAALIGAGVASVGHLILVGTSVPFAHFLIGALVAAPMPLVVALLVGGIAGNQIQAVAALKVVMMAYLTIPFVTILVPRAWHWPFYVFPNYWMFRTFENLYVATARAGDFGPAAVLCAVSGAAALTVLRLTLGKQLKPR